MQVLNSANTRLCSGAAAARARSGRGAKGGWMTDTELSEWRGSSWMRRAGRSSSCCRPFAERNKTNKECFGGAMPYADAADAASASTGSACCTES